jgi:hypothetical protein
MSQQKTMMFETRNSIAKDLRHLGLRRERPSSYTARFGRWDSSVADRWYWCRAKTTIAGAHVWKEDGREWVTDQEIQHETERFVKLGEAFERETGCVTRGRIGLAEAKLFSQRAAVDFAKEWLERQQQGEKN